VRVISSVPYISGFIFLIAVFFDPNFREGRINKKFGRNPYFYFLFFLMSSLRLDKIGKPVSLNCHLLVNYINYMSSYDFIIPTIKQDLRLVVLSDSQPVQNWDSTLLSISNKNKNNT
jgi:hypothetical protein